MIMTIRSLSVDLLVHVFMYSKLAEANIVTAIQFYFIIWDLRIHEKCRWFTRK